jgi:hypothetical protein
VSKILAQQQLAMVAKNPKKLFNRSRGCDRLAAHAPVTLRPEIDESPCRMRAPIAAGVQMQHTATCMGWKNQANRLTAAYVCTQSHVAQSSTL